MALSTGACAAAPKPSAVFVRPPAPHYPFTMHSAGIEGRVLVGALVGTDGKPKSVWIVESSGYDAFDNEAMSAVKLAVWPPRPQEVRAQVPINFRLE
ncbi:MAG TPA: energy transducer TonB [Dongiaceae bacterium]|nr:energy transducer TonB [Dongiaceae bacterium]